MESAQRVNILSFLYKMCDGEFLFALQCSAGVLFYEIY